MNTVPESSGRETDWHRKPLEDSGAAVGDEETIDVMSLLRVLWRRRGIIIGIVMLLEILAVVFLVQITPRYSAFALLTLDARKESVVDIEAVISGLAPDASVINTELDVLSSRRLVGKLVDARNLVKDPEFNGSLRPASPFASLLDPRTYLSHDWLVALGLSDVEETPLSEEEARQRERNKVIDAVSDALSVSNPGLSYTIRLSFETESAAKSAALANALAELYLTDQLEAKFEATERATNWLNERIGVLRERVRDAELAAQKFREQNEIIRASDKGTVREQQMGELNSQLIESETGLAAAMARFSAVSDMAARGAISALGAVLESSLIQRLREQEADVRRRQAEVTSRYGDLHPEVRKVEAELDIIQGKIREEVDKIVASVRNEVQVARSRVQTLQEKLNELQAANTQIEKARVELRELEREADSSRVLLETFLSRFKETANQEDMQQADARIISPAAVPTEASYPKKKLILMVVFVLAVMVGFGMAFLLEMLDHGYRTLDHVQKDTRTKGLGMVPRLSRGRLKGALPVDYALRNPTSSYAEALRAVQTTLFFGQNPSPRTIVVTSSLPREGKTTFCLSSARLVARAGNQRVLFVEADMRRGDVWKTITGGKEEKPKTLDDYLQADGIKSWRECLLTDKASGLHMILASGHCDNAQALLQSDRMKTLIDEASKAYDLIFFDSPPLLAVSDAVLLSHRADTTVVVVRWETTARDGVRSTLSILRKAEVRIGGIVMAQVDVKKHAKYGYGDYASYYGQYGHYYAN